MKVHEAIEALKADPSKWARPLWWRGDGIGIAIYSHTRVAVVPSATGGAHWHVSVRDLTDDWEVVEPDVILDERHPDTW